MKDTYRDRGERFDEKLGAYVPACADIMRITDAEWADNGDGTARLVVTDAEEAWCRYTAVGGMDNLRRRAGNCDLWHDPIPF